MILCLNDMKEGKITIIITCTLIIFIDGSEARLDSEQWVELTDRAGLVHVSDMTFMAFVSMKLELRKHLTIQNAITGIKEKALEAILDLLFKALEAILQNEDLLFYCMVKYFC